MSDTEGDALEQLMEFSDPEKRFLENMWIGFKAPPEVTLSPRTSLFLSSAPHQWTQVRNKVLALIFQPTMMPRFHAPLSSPGRRAEVVANPCASQLP